MKRVFAILVVVAFLLTGFSICFADVWVDGYYRSDGTYVKGHWRSDPDGDPSNNWSTKGNENPYTGKKGYKNPYRSSDPYNPYAPKRSRRRRSH